MRGKVIGLLRAIPFAALVGVGLPSCERGAPTATTSTADQTPLPLSASVAVSEARADTIDAAVSSHSGQVVVVDFWATWCAPCVKKFPHLVELHNKYSSQGLICISVSMDKWERTDEYRDQNGRDQVLAFLREKRATFENFILADPLKDVESLAGRYGQISVIPYMVAFDRAGRKVWDSDERRLSEADLDKMVAELVTK